MILAIDSYPAGFDAAPFRVPRLVCASRTLPVNRLRPDGPTLDNIRSERTRDVERRVIHRTLDVLGPRMFGTPTWSVEAILRTVLPRH